MDSKIIKDLTISKKIGIPRAISYYNNFPFYYGFFLALGFEIILSDKITSTIINEGAQYVVSDTCLPIKVFVGHVITYFQKAAIQYLSLLFNQQRTKLTTVRKLEACQKLFEML